MRKQGLDDNRERVDVILQLTAELVVSVMAKTTKHLTAIDVFCDLGEKKTILIIPLNIYLRSEYSTVNAKIIR